MNDLDLIPLNFREATPVAGGASAGLGTINIERGHRLVGSVRAHKALTLSVYQNPVTIAGDVVFLDKTDVSVSASSAEGGGTKVDVPLTGGPVKLVVTNSGTPSTDDTVAYASLYAKTVPSEISTAGLAASDLPTGIDAAKIGAGSVSNTEFGYLDGLSGAIQTQLNGKVSIPGSSAAGDILYHDGAGYVRLAKGTAGQVLAMNAGATAPEWVTLD